LTRSLILTLAAVGTTTIATSQSDDLISKFPSLVTWFRSHGGIIDDRVKIGYDEKGIRGTIATDFIPADTLLMHAPSSIMLNSDDGGRDQCNQIAKVVEELNKGEASKWHEYFSFDDSLGSRIPSQWDDRAHPEGRTGRAMMELQGLPPSGETHRHINWYKAYCLEGRDEEVSEVEWRALLIAMTRSSDRGLIPMYDLMNHHNGLINTRLAVDDAGFSVIAATDIAANEQIYNTYARSGWESSVDVFTTYGFVEDYPQIWRWADENLERLAMEDKRHAHRRYGSSEGRVFEPNSNHYEVLVLSPTLAALSPTKELVAPLGNWKHTMEEWEQLIANHHTTLRASHVSEMRESALALLESLPTTIEEDEKIIQFEKSGLERVTKAGRIHTSKADSVQAIEYRLAFKKALKLVADVAERERFYDDSEEL